MKRTIDIEAAMLVSSMGKLPGTDLEIISSEKAREEMELFVVGAMRESLIRADIDFMAGRKIEQLTNDYVIRFCMYADKWMLLADKAMRTGSVVDFADYADMLKVPSAFDHVAICFKEFVETNQIDSSKVGAFFGMFLSEVHRVVVGACAEAYTSRFKQRCNGGHKPFRPISWTYDRETDTFEYTCFSFGKERVLHP